MAASDRDLILARLEEGVAADPVPPYSAAPAPAPDALWPEFLHQFELLGGTTMSLGKLLPRLREAYVDPDALALLEARGAQGDVWGVEIGVTTALLAIAETGSLLLSSGEGRARLASLAPPHHVVLVRRRDIVASLQEAFDRLPNRNCVVISGPSRTADIEGVLVRGVHGPKEISVCIID